MPIKPQFETYTYAHTQTNIKTQSIVECRLTGVGEIASVLATRATATLTTAECMDGEVRYGGKLLLGVIYEDGEKNVCRIERGAEFTHKALDDKVTPASTAYVELCVLSSSIRREGASLYVSCVVEADIRVMGVKSLNLLTGGEGIITQTTDKKIVREEYASGQFEVEDEFETEFVGDILMHAENVYIRQVTSTAGGVTLSGEVAVNICALKDDGLDNYERLLPFQVELPCDIASVGMPCKANIVVQSASVTIGADEEKNSSKITLSVTLSARATVYVEETLKAVCDLFSVETELKIGRETCEFAWVTGRHCYVEKVSGVASISAPIDYSSALQALVLQRAETACVVGENVEEIEGVVTATLIVKGTGGEHRAIFVQLPFSLPLKTPLSGKKEVSAVVLGMSVRQKREGEAEVEATLKLAVESVESCQMEYICSLEEGAAVEANDSAFSVFLPREGDGLWEIAKALKKRPDEVVKSNPDMTFPVKKGERIIIYRQKA